jgi:hypothetical protein
MWNCSYCSSAAILAVAVSERESRLPGQRAMGYTWPPFDKKDYICFCPFIKTRLGNGLQVRSSTVSQLTSGFSQQLKQAQCNRGEKFKNVE